MNRFTQNLDDIRCSPNTILWADIESATCPRIFEAFIDIWDLTENNSKERMQVKILAASLIANMSDQDLFDIFGV